MSGSREHDAFAATIATDTEGKLTLPAAPTTDVGARQVLAGRWEVVGIIGSGGMGTVYRAHDRELDEDVALKVLRHEVIAGADVERFRREVKLARKVTHKNVARVFELGEHEGKRFFTMELVEGESLRGRLERGGPLREEVLTKVALSVSRGLGAAHEVGVIHRDLKPDNVLVAKDGRVAITDFGIASSLDASGVAGETQTFIGTPHYMAPEQVDGSGRLDARTDIYALGAMLFELATGRLPFEGPSAVAVAAARLTRPPPDPRASRPTLSASLAAIILRCMARDPADRFPNAEAVEAALSLEPERGATTSLPPASILPPESRPSRTGPLRQVRIAVLPFSSTGLTDDTYLESGLAEDLVDALSVVDGMRVVAYGAAAQHTAADAREAGRALGVEVLVQGALRRLPDGRLRLSVRLVSVEDGIQLWAKRFDASAAELLDVNESAAQAIAEAASIRAPQADRKLADPVAIELYLRARSHYRDFWVEGAQESARCYAEALARAPESPLLIAGYALSLARVSFFTAGEIHSARAAAARALSLAPDLGEAHLAAGAVAFQEGDFAEAYRHARAAVARAPSLAEAHLLAGRVLAETGPLDHALRVLRSAQELDPGSGVARRELVRALALKGRLNEAYGIIRRPSAEVFDKISSLIIEARLAVWRGDLETILQVRESFQALEREEPNMPALSVFVRALVAAIDERSALDVNRFLLALSDDVGNVRRVLFFHQVAVETNARFGTADAALELLTKTVALGLVDAVWLEHCPALDPLRADPRFWPLVEVVRERTAPVRALVAAEQAS